MFSKLLIANRGEIACRIINTCKRLGIETVTVYSGAEGRPLHAELADKAVLLPDSPNPVSGYLAIETMVEVAREVGAEAVHPGYGFLSETASKLSAPRPMASRTATWTSSRLNVSMSLSTYTNSLLPRLPIRDSSRRRRVPNSSGRSQPTSGAAWSRALVLRSSSGR